MNKYFSITTGGFYAPELRSDYEAAGTWPSDGIEVGPEIEERIREALTRRDTVSFDENGWHFLAHVPTQAETFAELQATARRTLSESDLTIIRCYENGTPVPADWATYRQTLRAIVGGANTGELPAQPPYPEGS